ncbi:MAG TPA: metallophosphoesterase [Kofleriaceae bacterium]|jgi:3',5'-cyclic AMP phosphodiesterase CpdA
MTVHRRDFFKLAGGALFVGACGPRIIRSAGAREPTAARRDGFVIMQITDTHWGYAGPANPHPKESVERAVAEIAAWPEAPDLVIHTGDISQLTPDAGERRARLAEAHALFGRLGAKLYAVPGEHDASLDGGAAFREVFGDARWAFEHRGAYLIGLDNSTGTIGAEQLAWLGAEVAKVPAGAQLLVFAHRPLFPLAEKWDWFTRDGAQALAAIEQHPGATVFYGHIHQAHIARTNRTTHVATRALVFPMPAPGSQPEKQALPWDDAALDHGLGYRGIALEGASPASPVWTERALVG